MEFTAEHVRIYGGLYEINRHNLEDLRHFIATNPSDFKSVISNKTFTNTYGQILGDKSKRIPKELKEAAEKQELIYNKQLYFFNELAPETILDNDLLEIVMKHFKAAKPFNEFVSKAIHY
jgi:uncharacterized protein (DUF2461 family)